MTANRSSSRLIVLLLLLLPVCFFMIPENVVMEAGEHLCLIKAVTGHECPGCGTTRAIWCILHFRFSEAWTFNHASFAVFAVLAWLWGRQVVDRYRMCGA